MVVRLALSLVLSDTRYQEQAAQAPQAHWLVKRMVNGIRQDSVCQVCLSACVPVCLHVYLSVCARVHLQHP